MRPGLWGLPRCVTHRGWGDGLGGDGGAVRLPVLPVSARAMGGRGIRLRPPPCVFEGVRRGRGRAGALGRVGPVLPLARASGLHVAEGKGVAA